MSPAFDARHWACSSAMNILFVTSLWYPDYIGGASRLITEEAKRLAGRGHRVSVLTRQVGGYPWEEHQDGLTIRRFPIALHGPLFHLSEMASGFREVRRELKRADFDVMHIHLPLVGVGATWARIKGLPIVASFYSIWALEWEQEQAFKRGGVGGLSSWQRIAFRYLLWLDRRVCRASQKAVALSEFGRDLCVWHLGARPDRVQVIPGAADGETFVPSHRDEAWRRSQAPGGEVLLFTARRLVARTGVDVLLEAAALLNRDRILFRLIIAGEGDQKEALTLQRDRLGLAEAVSFVGFVSDQDLRRMMASSDLFILPTVAYEGFGMATVEALASGTPVVGTPVGATPEILSPLDPRLVARSAAPKDLAQAIRVLLSDREGLARLRGTSAAYAREKYNWDSHISALEETYASVRDGIGRNIQDPPSPLPSPSR